MRWDIAVKYMFVKHQWSCGDIDCMYKTWRHNIHYKYTFSISSRSNSLDNMRNVKNGTHVRVRLPKRCGRLYVIL